MIVAKIHKNNDGRIILAVCDKDILGRIFEDEKRMLDLTADFYKGIERKKEELVLLYKNAYVIHAVGKESVSLAIELRLARKEDTMKIKEVPYLQIVAM